MSSKRVLTIVVVVSLVVNLLLIGMLLGRIAGPGPELRRLDPVIGMHRLLSELPDERARALAPLYRDYFHAMRPSFRDIRGAQQNLREAMLTDPLDEQAVRDALTNFRQHLFETQASTHDALVALLSELTLAERQQLVASMNDRPPRNRRPRSAPPGGRPPDEPFHQIPPDPPPR